MATMTPPAKTEKFAESSSASFDSIDRDAGVIRGVRVLGLESKNGRQYLREAVRKAIGLYEGARVYFDHSQNAERSTRERWGRLVNVREASDGGLVADLEYVRSNPYTEAILEAAERFRDIGLSHDTLGRSEIREGKRVVTEIVKVNSVDLVENPATVENLWEQDMSEAATKRLKVLAVLRENRAKVSVADEFLNRLAKLSESQPKAMLEMGIDDVELEMAENDPFEGDEAVKAALKQAILAVLDGPDDSATTMKKIKMLMDAGDKVSGSANQVSDEDKDKMEESMKTGDDKLDQMLETLTSKIDEKLGKLDAALGRLEESESLSQQNRVRGECLQLLESKGREATDERLRLLAGVPEGDRDALVESWPQAIPKPGTSRPRYSSSESGATSSYQEARKNVRCLNK